MNLTFLLFFLFTQHNNTKKIRSMYGMLSQTASKGNILAFSLFCNECHQKKNAKILVFKSSRSAFSQLGKNNNFVLLYLHITERNYYICTL